MVEFNADVLDCDVCIVGGGPAGLAVLSALANPFSNEGLTEEQIQRLQRARTQTAKGRGQKKIRVVVVDLFGSWMKAWRQRFASLEINFLRSPATAHPDMFDSESLVSFAYQRGRQDELLDTQLDQVKQLRSLPAVHSGQLRLPSNQLFLDFCDHIAEQVADVCAVTWVRGTAQRVTGTDGDFLVEIAPHAAAPASLSNAGDCGYQQLCASAVVLAIGSPGTSIVPSELHDLSRSRLLSSPFEALGSRLHELRLGQRVLVVGGGLTAVQTAILAVRRGCAEVVLCSRRCLSRKHFDVPLKWMDGRKVNHLMFQFFQTPVDERRGFIAQTRHGGSVPPVYLEELERQTELGTLRVVVGEAQLQSPFTNSTLESPAIAVSIEGHRYVFDAVVCACGTTIDCTVPADGLLVRLVQSHPVELSDGIPLLSQYCQWGTCKRLFVVGALAALSIGPDAGNLMGIRRAARFVADQLGLRAWMREESNCLSNTFAVLGDM
eukprot:Clim_evm112s147 gene=Clim_evmTU112s147